MFDALESNSNKFAKNYVIFLKFYYYDGVGILLFTISIGETHEKLK